MGLSLRKKALFLAIACMPLSVVLADGDGVTSENVVPFAYGDMDNWIVREIHESGIIGGNTKWLYELGPSDTIVGNTAFRNMGGSPWATSNVMAKVAGVVKTNTSVFPEKRKRKVIFHYGKDKGQNNWLLFSAALHILKSHLRCHSSFLLPL